MRWSGLRWLGLVHELLRHSRIGLRNFRSGRANQRSVLEGASKLTLRLPDGTQRRLPSKGAFIAPTGAVIEMEAPGSGGYGPPPGRDRGLLAQDLLDGYVTVEAARRDYGPDAI